ncbi:MAG: hypothetical protein HOQ22_02350 [Nocardioidaceae bacterium]|nr:hypothetical protein [Nocardioidaceae bacterium]
MPVSPLPATGEVFLDARGPERALRVTWHPEADVVVLSLWSGGVCTGTFRLPFDEVPDLVEALRSSLASAFDVTRAARHDSAC